MHLRFLKDWSEVRAGEERTVTTELALKLIDDGIAEPAGKSIARPPADKSMTGRRVENK